MLKIMINLRITNIRKSLGLTKKDLATKLKVNVNTVKWWEILHHDLTASSVIKICKVLNVNSEYLLFGRGEMFCRNERNLV